MKGLDGWGDAREVTSPAEKTPHLAVSLFLVPAAHRRKTTMNSLRGSAATVPHTESIRRVGEGCNVM